MPKLDTEVNEFLYVGRRHRVECRAGSISSSPRAFPTYPQELIQQLRTEIGQTFYDDFDLMKALVIWELIDHLQDCSFGS